MFHFARSSRGTKRVIVHRGWTTLLTGQAMASQNGQSIIVERPGEVVAARAGKVVQLHEKREEIETGFQTFDAEYHAAGFCACCMPGE